MKKSGKKSYFSEDGSRYFITDPELMKSAWHELWNDQYLLRADQKGFVGIGFTRPDGMHYAGEQRCFYIRDEQNGKWWTAPYNPFETRPDVFEFSYGAADASWRVVRNGIEFTARLVVPWDDTVELWTITARNLSTIRRDLSLYSYFPIAPRSWFRSRADFHRWLNGMVYEFLVNYADPADYYKRLAESWKTVCVSDVKPSAYELSAVEFKGSKGVYGPAGLDKKRLSCEGAILDAPAAAFQFSCKLSPGQSHTVNLVFGPAKDMKDVRRLRQVYLRPGGIEKALARVQALYECCAPDVKIKTPDKALDAFVNNWLAWQNLMLARTSSHSSVGTTRNVFQNAAGAVYSDPSHMSRLCSLIYRNQDTKGFLPSGTPLVEGAVPQGIRALPHRDGNVWAPPQIKYHIWETGDLAILDEMIPWKDSPKASSLYEHVSRGLTQQLADRSRRGLCRIGKGDWCDPLNAAGPKGKGESVWLTLALVWALDSWADVADLKGDKTFSKLCRREAGKCRAAVNRHAWNGDWYARGSTDAGRWFGTKGEKEGSMFLNPQAWALMTHSASPARMKRLMASVRKHLATPWGLAMLAPPYTKFHADIGKLSVKHAGMEENGSAYNQPQLFYVHGLYENRFADEAFRIMRALIPGSKENPVEKLGQPPTFIANTQLTAAAGRYAGRSSQVNNTGSAPWLYRMVVTMLLGIQGEPGGLRIDPQLPGKWKTARVKRVFRGAEFDISIRRSSKVSKTTLIFDGRRLTGALIPRQAAGTKHVVRVLVPA